MSLRRTRTRTLAAVGLLAAAGLFLTGCGPEESSAAPAASSTTDAGADAGTEPPADPADPGDDAAADPGAVDNPDANDGGEGEAGADNRVDGTVTGPLTYVAPGKLEVDGRPFWVAEDTEITGGEICGDPETPEAETCTPEELDDYAKAGGPDVTVTIKKGIAEQVTQASL
ncbi:hypothetical protein ACFT9I_21700 [Streptomyces sp. NPDC057137]|uniref:hypothetical protein n=1 Tax=Streptomyces sp. NPDC057137 TaxID=3346030 RepID=UPI00362A149B